MKLNAAICYEIIQNKDHRFDGLFYTAVRTTGIYCRPVCRVPAPKKENCDFYETPQQAEAAGFRPCLRCRPEMAPEYSEFHQSQQVINDLVHFFEEHNNSSNLIQRSSEHFGISTRHIHRLFMKTFGTSPSQYIMTKRLLNGKRLLQETSMSITNIAEVIGFGQLSLFEKAMKQHYGFSPKALRKDKEKETTTDSIGLKLFYRPPYDWKRMMDFYRLRSIPGVEWVTENNIYRRTLRIMDQDTLYCGWIEINPINNEHYIELKVSNSLGNVIIRIINKVKGAFDLDLNPQSLPEDVDPDTRLPGSFDGFETCVRAILGQQITVKAASTLSGRLVEAYAIKAETPWERLTHYFPTPSELLTLHDQPIDTMGQVGIIGSRGNSIKELAQNIVDGNIHFKHQNIEVWINTMTKIKGIGQWTARYVAMRAFSWPDILLVSDLVIKQTLVNVLNDKESGLLLKELETDMSKYRFNKLYEDCATEYGIRFKPWRSYLTLQLWKDSLM